MKRILSVILAAVMLFSCCAMNSFAATAAKTANFTLKASVMDASASGQAQDKTAYLNATNKVVYDSKNNPTVEVKPGQVVWVTVHLETGSKFYAGDWQGRLFYTNNIFTSTTVRSGNYIWATEGEYAGVCDHGGAPFSQMIANAINRSAPTNWSDSQKSAHECYSMFMYPNPTVTTTVVANVNDDLVTVPIYVKPDAQVGATGAIFFPEGSLISKDTAPEFPFILSTYKNGNILDQNIQDSSEYAVNISKAKLNFKVVSTTGDKTGDINNDGSINSNDALLVLQYATGTVTLSAAQKASADTNKDNAVNSIDALAILQYATGIITRF